MYFRNVAVEQLTITDLFCTKPYTTLYPENGTRETPSLSKTYTRN